MSADQEFTREEVAKHCTDKDCWLIIADKVYDVTEYLNDHPGGPDTMAEHAGKDATEGFEDTGHSASARAIMKKYLKGRVAGAPAAADATAAAPAAGAASKPPASSSDHGGSPLAYAIPVLILVAALVYQFYVKPTLAK